jgi:RNA polymerase sigma-70 factor (ECF subfamily)
MDERGHPREIDADALLAQSGWVSALARGLVHDRAAAEDAVQETWLAALRHAPREPGRLRPWLAHVLANVARKQRRGDTHRTEREAHAARREGLPSASDVAAKLEAQRLLVAALDTLEEPYKTTIVLRYLDGIDSAEIARRANVPAGTVRWRLKEGLARLRAKLDADAHGDRATWALALFPFVPPPPLSNLAASALAASPGVVIMSVLSRGTWIAAAVVLAALGVYVFVDARSTAPRESTLEVARAIALDADTGANVVHVEPEPERAALATVTSASTESLVVPAFRVLEGRVVDETRTPLARVSIEARELPACAPSDDDGRFRIQVPVKGAPTLVRFTLRTAGFATRFESVQPPVGEVVQLGELALARAAVVRGRIVDDQGVPLRDARVFVAPAALGLGSPERFRLHGMPRDLAVVETKTSADGRFEIADAAPGVVNVIAELASVGVAASEALELVRGGSSVLPDLVLSSCSGCDHISGRVLDPAGAPCAGAIVRFAPRGVRRSAEFATLTAADDGTFSIPVTEQGSYRLRARDVAKRWSEVEGDALPGQANVELRLRRADRLLVRVRDAEGEPVSNVTIGTSIDRSEAPAQFRSWSAEAFGESNDTHIRRPEAPFHLVAESDAFARAELGPFDPAQLGDTLDVVLEPLPVIRGRVVTAGEGVVGAHVELHAHERDTVYMCDGYSARFDSSTAAKVTTGAAGVFALPLRTAGRFVALAEDSGFALAELEFEIADVAHPGELELVLVRGGTLAGRVRAEDGVDPAGTIVALNRYDGRPRTVRADRDGRFTIGGLTPGDWNVTSARRELEPQPRMRASRTTEYGETPFASNCRIEDGAVTEFVLDLRSEARARWLAHVTLDGAPALGWTYRVSDRFASAAADDIVGAIDANGDAVAVVAPGLYRVDLAPPPEIGVRAGFEAELDLVRGANPWPLALESGRVTGHVSGASGGSYSYAWTRDGISIRIGIQPDAVGAFALPWVPAGSGAIEIYWSSMGGTVRHPPRRIPVVAVRGETVHVEIE